MISVYFSFREILPCDLNATAYMHSSYPKLARQEALMLNVFDVLVHTKRQMPIEAVKKGL